MHCRSTSNALPSEVRSSSNFSLLHAARSLAEGSNRRFGTTVTDKATLEAGKTSESKDQTDLFANYQEQSA
jgi:hypothetical protein